MQVIWHMVKRNENKLITIMKTYFKLVVAFFVSIVLFSCTSTNKPVDGSYSFQLYATNDIHGRYFDSLYVEGNDGEWINRHSLASIATKINEARHKIGEENVLLLDIGDHLQGDNAPFYYNFIDTVSPHIYPQIANYLKYDALVVGNHDIETGHNVYDRVAAQFDMPYLAANAIDVTTNKPYFQPYTIINKQGVKIAVIGLTNPNVPSWLSPELWSGMEFEDIVSSLEYWVDYVKKADKPHIIIAAMHAGLGDEDVNALENPSRYVAKHVKGIDLVLASHDHRVAAETYNNGEKDIWLLEAGSRASNLSLASLSFDIIDGNIENLEVKGESIKIEGVEPDSNYMSHFRNAFKSVREFTNRKVGELAEDIDSRDAYFGPSLYVDMIHSIQLKASGADISFVAPLSFSKQISKGVLNYQNLLDIYPFENQLNMMELSGQEIKDYLEYSYSLWVSPNPRQIGHLLNLNDGVGESFKLKSPHYNFDSAAGIIYEVDITKPVNERVNIVSMADGAAFELSDKYTVAITSYRASGGGDLLIEGAGIPHNELQSRIVARFSDIREILYNQIQDEGVLEPKTLNQWKFVPEALASKLGEKDYNIMFGE